MNNIEEASYKKIRGIVGKLIKNKVVEIGGIDVVRAIEINNIASDIAEKMVYKYKVRV